jgi:DegV family protein with EDD domain
MFEVNKVMKFKITADSTCDLSKDLIQKYDFDIIPVMVVLDGKAYRDNVDIFPQDIFNFVEKTNTLPHTASCSEQDFYDFFKKYVDQGYHVIHFDITTTASALYETASRAAKSFNGNVTVIDTKQLSSGESLLMIKAYEMGQAGKTLEEIVAAVTDLRNKVNTSFVPDNLEYLYKGGRCSRLALTGAKFMGIHPLILMDNGSLRPDKKYMGTMERCIKNYIKDLKEKYPEYDKSRCFITHSGSPEEIVNVAKEKVAELFNFDEVIEQVAASTVSVHCGKDTLGVLFIHK